MAVEPRFYTVNEVATLLATTPNHVHAMLKRQELPGIKIGNRGQWRIERVELADHHQVAAGRAGLDEALLDDEFVAGERLALHGDVADPRRVGREVETAHELAEEAALEHDPATSERY